MRDGHEMACEAIQSMLDLLETDQIFKMTLTGLDDDRTETLMLFYADSLGVLHEALKQMLAEHEAELN